MSEHLNPAVRRYETCESHYNPLGLFFQLTNQLGGQVNLCHLFDSFKATQFCAFLFALDRFSCAYHL